MQLGHESMINLSLNLFFSDHEPCQTIVGPLLHSLHGVEFTGSFAFGVKAFDQIDFSVGSCPEQPLTLEVFSAHIKGAESYLP